jgi:hypothetical protein
METSYRGLRRIRQAKELAKTYFELPDKAHINKPDQLLLLFSIKVYAKKKHPHQGYKVYISRRALKHFVERRREELLKNHTPEESLRIIYFALNKIRETIIRYDSWELTDSRYSYTKDYSTLDKHLLRIIADEKKDSLEICSIHFKTKRNVNMG